MASSLKLPLKATLVLLFLLSLVSQQTYLATATKLARDGSKTQQVPAGARPYARGRLMLRNKKMEIEAFRPTAPGHSPGMGHDNPPGRLMLRNKKMEAEAFRPTAPGHSPGMGHDNPPGRLMLRNKKMGTEAFRPTAPGHSPGMGHDTPPESRK